MKNWKDVSLKFCIGQNYCFSTVIKTRVLFVSFFVSACNFVSLKVAWRILEFPIHSELLGDKIIDVFILWIIWSAWDRKHLRTVIYCTAQWVCLGSVWVWFGVLFFIFSQGFLLTCFLLTVFNLPVFTLRQASVLLITPFIIVLRTLPSGVKLILCSLHHDLLQLN